MGSKASPIFSVPRPTGIWRAAAVAFICFLVGLTLTFYVAGLVKDIIASQHQQEVLTKLSEARARLEGQVGAAISLGKGLRGYVIQGRLTQDEFEKFGSELIDDVPFIRSIGLGPGNVLQFIYPVKGNEKAIGTDYRSNAEQWPSIEKATKQRSSILAGPVDLVQGGRALLVRVPVFLPAYPNQPVAERSYWGVATLVIDEAKLFEAAGLVKQAGGHRFAIISTADDGGARQLIFGDAALSAVNSVKLPLILPGGKRWEILSSPVDGWATNSEEVWMSLALGMVITLIISAMAFLLIREVFKVRAMALHDHLTGLANRRLLEDRMQQLAALSDRNGGGFEIFYIDLDAFKPVNDNYGHAVGDKVLVEIGRRLKAGIRQTDTVARVGGDEFIVLTAGAMTDEQREHFLDRLRKNVCREFILPDGTLGISVSIGFASYPKEARTISDLLRVADTRMYTQKTG